MSRILTGEKGYSLPELLVTMAMIGIISLSVTQLIRVSVQTHTRAASLEFSQMGARAGLNGIATDLRYLGSYYSRVAGAGAAITVATATSLTFLGDVDGNTLDAAGGENTLAAPANAGSTQMTVIRATDPSGNPAFGVGGWVYVGSGSTGEVVRITAVAGTVISFPQPGLVKTYPAESRVRSVETVAYTFNAPPTGTLTRRINGGEPAVMVDNVNGLAFTYYNGANPPAVTADASLIRQIDVGVTVTQPDGGSRTMATRIRPVSLGP